MLSYPFSKLPGNAPIYRGRACRGFMLSEVVIAIAIVAFGMLAVFSLLPVGLGAVKNAEEEGASVAALERIAAAIWAARPDVASPSSYQAAGVYSDLSWSISGSVQEHEWDNLSFGGEPTSTTSAQRLCARVKLTPPPNETSPGSAFITVAWPSSTEWDAASNQWAQPQGSVTSQIIFLPSR